MWIMPLRVNKNPDDDNLDDDVYDAFIWTLTLENLSSVVCESDQLHWYSLIGKYHI